MDNTLYDVRVDVCILVIHMDNETFYQKTICLNWNRCRYDNVIYIFFVGNGIKYAYLVDGPFISWIYSSMFEISLYICTPRINKTYVCTPKQICTQQRLYTCTHI